MKIIKRAASLILALTLALSISISLSVVVSAERKDYYIVSGTIYDDGTAYIESAEIVLGIEDAAGNGGYDYVIIAEDYDYNVIDSKSFSVKFTGYPDGIGTVSEVPFTVLIPYNEAIVNFSLYDSSDMRLWDFEINNSIDVSEYNITQNDYGFSLSWSGDEGLTYDVTAVSQISGLRSVLLYKSEDSSLEIPFEWLEPNDIVTFELAAYSGNGTAIFNSDSFDTPDGEAAVFGDADGEEWAEGSGDIGGSESEAYDTATDIVAILIIVSIIVGALVFVIGIPLLIIVLVTKKKKG
jgi:hypothetical protein